MAGDMVGHAVIPYYNHILYLLDSDPSLRKTFQGVLHQVGYTAGGTAVGGLFGGPIGAVFGAAIGAGLGYWTVEDYDSMVKVLKDMSESNKKELVRRVQRMVGNGDIQSLTSFIVTAAGKTDFIKLVKTFSGEVKG